MSLKTRIYKMEKLIIEDNDIEKRMFMVSISEDGTYNAEYMYTMSNFDRNGIARKNCDESIKGIEQATEEEYEAWKAKNIRSNDYVINTYII